jgi:hypothetical protein
MSLYPLATASSHDVALPQSLSEVPFGQAQMLMLRQVGAWQWKFSDAIVAPPYLLPRMV